MESYEGKKILIAGLGLSGQAVFEALLDTESDISVCDDGDVEHKDPNFYKKLKESGVPAYLKGKIIPDVHWDMVILSPGISPESDFVRRAENKGSEITGELEFAYKTTRGRYIAITGTNGKTTVTALVGQIFKNSGKKTVVAGNIGVPAVSFSGDTDDDTVIVTEVSSFQLETISEFRPEVSAILNLTPDHLDRHKSMDNYGDVKSRIFMNQDKTDYLIYNADCPYVSELVTDAPADKVPFSRMNELKKGAFIKGGRLLIKDAAGKQTDLISVAELKIPGIHNIENALAASAIAYFGGVAPEIIRETLRTFEGVEHRLELADVKNCIRFVNDSKGTNPDASIKAIEAAGDNIILIAGGYDKKSDFSEFVNSFKDRVKALILIGETSEKIKKTAEKAGFTHIYQCDGMGDAVETGYRLASEGDTVLLSPACASWGMYKNFEERGGHFKELVKELSRQ